MITITEDNYPDAVGALVGVARVVLDATARLDVPQMRVLCERLQASGPDGPDTARRAGDLTVEDQAALIDAFETFQTALRRLEHRPEGA